LTWRTEKATIADRRPHGEPGNGSAISRAPKPGAHSNWTPESWPRAQADRSGSSATATRSKPAAGGAFALIDAVAYPGGGSPPHVHTREDEAFYILDGELAFHADNRDFTAATGAWISLAKESLHYFKNTGSTSARMLILVTPAGLENFFLEIGRDAIDDESEPVLHQ
jgi:quercetin dioxygenase-like cupin family protein